MKYETCGVPINIFVGWKTKIYNYIRNTDHECKELKSINKNVVDDELNYEFYKKILFNWTYMRHEMSRIQSKDHDIGTYRIRSVYLKASVIGYRVFINLLVNHAKRKYFCWM